MAHWVRDHHATSIHKQQSQFIFNHTHHNDRHCGLSEQSTYISDKQVRYSHSGTVVTSTADQALDLSLKSPIKKHKSLRKLQNQTPVIEPLRQHHHVAQYIPSFTQHQHQMVKSDSMFGPPSTFNAIFCNHCKFQTYTEYCMLTHLLYNHCDKVLPPQCKVYSNTMQFGCPYCGIRSNQSGMAYHLLEAHRNSDPCRRCAECLDPITRSLRSQFGVLPCGATRKQKRNVRKPCSKLKKLAPKPVPQNDRASRQIGALSSSVVETKRPVVNLEPVESAAREQAMSQHENRPAEEESSSTRSISGNSEVAAALKQPGCNESYILASQDARKQSDCVVSHKTLIETPATESHQSHADESTLPVSIVRSDDSLWKEKVCSARTFNSSSFLPMLYKDFQSNLSRLPPRKNQDAGVLSLPLSIPIEPDEGSTVIQYKVQGQTASSIQTVDENQQNLQSIRVNPNGLSTAAVKSQNSITEDASPRDQDKLRTVPDISVTNAPTYTECASPRASLDTDKSSTSTTKTLACSPSTITEYVSTRVSINEDKSTFLDKTLTYSPSIIVENISSRDENKSMETATNSSTIAVNASPSASLAEDKSTGIPDQTVASSFATSTDKVSPKVHVNDRISTAPNQTATNCHTITASANASHSASLAEDKSTAITDKIANNSSSTIHGNATLDEDKSITVLSETLASTPKYEKAAVTDAPNMVSTDGTNRTKKLAMLLKSKLSKFWAKPKLAAEGEKSQEISSENTGGVDNSDSHEVLPHKNAKQRINDLGKGKGLSIVLEKCSAVDSYAHAGFRNRIILKRVSEGHYVVESSDGVGAAQSSDTDNEPMDTEAPATPSSLAASSVGCSVDSGFEDVFSDDTRVICPYCPKQLVLNLLPAHMKFHDSKCLYQCSQCSFSTSYKWVLDTHTACHRDEPPIDVRKLTVEQWLHLRERFTTDGDVHSENAKKLVISAGKNTAKRQIAKKKGVSKRQALTNDVQPKVVTKTMSFTADKTAAVNTDDFLQHMIASRSKSGPT